MVTRDRLREVEPADDPTPTGTGSPPRQSPGFPWPELQKAWQAFGKHVPEMREDLSCYASVQVDRVRLAVAGAVTKLAFAILAMIAAAAVFATATSLLIVGVAGGLAAALDGKVWLANLLTGAIVLGLFGGAIALGAAALKRGRLQRLQQRYARHEQRQRAAEAAASIQEGEHVQGS